MTARKPSHLLPLERSKSPTLLFMERAARRVWKLWAAALKKGKR